MKTVILIVAFLTIIPVGFGQNELVKVDTIYSLDGIAHRILNFKPESEFNHLELALKCKVKADSLLKKHFDLNFFNENIFLNAEISRWYNINNNGRTTQIFNYKSENPKKVELVYSIINKNTCCFNLIEVTLECEKEIKVINTFGVPKTYNYKINIDYDKAIQIAKNKGFKENLNSEDNDKYSIELETLSLDFTSDNTYQWKIHKNVKRKITRKDRITINSKALFIDAETGKTTTKKIKHFVGCIRWF